MRLAKQVPLSRRIFETPPLVGGAQRSGAHPTVRRGWLLILAFSIQLVAIYVISDPSALAPKKAILAFTTALLVWAVLPNLRRWSFRILAVGLVLNTIVIAANGGLMPATPDNLQKVLSPSQVEELELGQSPPGSKNILVSESDAKLRLLSDVVYIGVPTSKVYSIGDLFLMAGVVSFALEAAVAVVVRRRVRHRIPL